MEEKTIEEWLFELPEVICNQALLNMSEGVKNDKTNSLSNAIQMAFQWSNTEQGYKYWHSVCMNS